LSILGGEPLSKLSDNRKQVISLAKEVKEKFPTKDIWAWSGYLLDEIQTNDSMKDILKYIDVLVDGPFIEEQKDLNIPFRGSNNQRILYKGKDF
jgi:anaerobic ribonucleoside-triphosphate reductase activating protein